MLAQPRLQPVTHSLLAKHGLELLVYRCDQLHPHLSGNKWYKNKYNLCAAIEQGYETIVSFGGAYSNHLHALAYAGKKYNLKTIGIVRGELNLPLTPTLQDARDWGMQLLALSRSDYRCRHQPEFIKQLLQPFGHCYLIPEGGANRLAVQGCAEIAQTIQWQLPDFDYLCTPCGTGATLAGLLTGLSGDSAQVLGFSALKGATDLEKRVLGMIASDDAGNSCRWQIFHGFHCGGFAKLSPDLVAFMDEWALYSNIPLEPIYTGKMFYGLFQLIAVGKFESGSRIVVVHTGGLQGLRGMRDKMAQMRLHHAYRGQSFGVTK